MDSNNNFDFNASMSLSEGVSDEEVSTEETENSRFTGILYQIVCVVNLIFVLVMILLFNLFLVYILYNLLCSIFYSTTLLFIIFSLYNHNFCINDHCKQTKFLLINI